MEPRRVAHPSLDERRALGRRARTQTPRSSHTGWTPAADRPDPIALLEAQNTTRDPDLVPVRHGRMMVSPFTFYRGGAKIMAADLKDTPRAGLTVQLCGDAHLSNFGVFASPERTLLFDLNDFDETLPGPFEYDVKRMAASFTIAARNNGFSTAEAHDVTLAAARAYREAMAEFAEMRVLDIWYARRSEADLLEAIRAFQPAATPKAKRQAAKQPQPKLSKPTAEGRAQLLAKGMQKARTRDSLQALSKLAELVDGTYRIVSQPPIVIPARELEATYGVSADELQHVIHRQHRDYRATLQSDRRHLLERFEIVDMARKVVGVGSVGTRAFIVLLQGRDQQDPLFLQVKEATSSVLEDHLPRSRHQPGARVVHGQRMMQAASDIFLGWTKGDQPGALPVLAPAARHEGLRASRETEAPRSLVLRRPVRVDAGSRPRARGRPRRHRLVSRQARPVRRGDRRLLAALRRPERARLRDLRRGHRIRAAGGARGPLSDRGDGL